ncbi:hypothetical protein OH76DRAFT_997500 [Lentinus brumalis]|uniref:Uncharacterized protein n=1 Tax=Lentinus brumalis TaxID=2498619 RepID=A0A371DQJ0_9APHY|nr:hypothetical protein OH76DRAFT_997500 [Polyporus brumalis]
MSAPHIASIRSIASGHSSSTGNTASSPLTRPVCRQLMTRLDIYISSSACTSTHTYGHVQTSNSTLHPSHAGWDSAPPIPYGTFAGRLLSGCLLLPAQIRIVGGNRQRGTTVWGSRSRDRGSSPEGIKGATATLEDCPAGISRRQSSVGPCRCPTGGEHKGAVVDRCRAYRPGPRSEHASKLDGAQESGGGGHADIDVSVSGQCLVELIIFCSVRWDLCTYEHDG